MMNSQWRAVQSFQENQNLISAINTLSIHIKLEMAGQSDIDMVDTVSKAREELCRFLAELDTQVSRVEVENVSLLGVDPRRRQFVNHLIDAKNSCRISSPFLEDLSDVQHLLYSDKERDKNHILCLLEELRMLLEEHLGSDVEQLFGGM